MTRSQRKVELVPIVADMLALRFSADRIAREMTNRGVPISGRQVRYISDDLGYSEPAQVPQHIADRIDTLAVNTSESEPK